VEVDVDVMVTVFTAVGVEVLVVVDAPVFVEACPVVFVAVPVTEAVAVDTAGTTVTVIVAPEATSGLPPSGGFPTPTPGLSAQASPSVLSSATAPIDRVLRVVVMVVPFGRQSDASGMPADP
jgi:hypothetical protein